MKKGIDIIRALWKDPLDNIGIKSIEGRNVISIRRVQEGCHCKGWTHEMDCPYYEYPYGGSPFHRNIKDFCRWSEYWSQSRIY
jgi:hypothetical protein